MAVNHPVGGSNPSPGANLNHFVSYFVYILKSESTSQYYIGHTDDIVRRISQHNDANYQGSKHTKRVEGPWRCVYKEQYATRSAAMKREKEMKEKEQIVYRISAEPAEEFGNPSPGATKIKGLQRCKPFLIVNKIV